MTANPKSVLSMKPHLDLGIAQKSVFYLMQMLRKTYDVSLPLFSDSVKADENCIGGLDENKQKSTKPKTGRGSVNKAIVVGVKDREIWRVVANAASGIKGTTLQDFMEVESGPESQVYTDGGCIGIDNVCTSANHSPGEYVRDMAHAKGIKIFWNMLEWAHRGKSHKFSKKHLDRYVIELVGRYNTRNADNLQQMRRTVEGVIGKKLTYGQLIAENGLSSEVRS